MTATGEIAIGTSVELTEPIEAAPAGARGGVTDLIDRDMAIVEFIELPLEPVLDRIAVVPIEKLRLL